MSRAFVKEEEGGKWIPPAAPRAFQVRWVAGDTPEVLFESDDLVEALAWLTGRERSGFELREVGGTLLASDV